MDNSFEGTGDFSSNDPFQRHLAHQAAKGADVAKKIWGPQHYNAVAKEIRELWPERKDADTIENISAVVIRGTLATLALSFTVRFREDSDRSSEGLIFDAEKFLNQCTPDPKAYPLHTLWKVYNAPDL